MSGAIEEFKASLSVVWALLENVNDRAATQSTMLKDATLRLQLLFSEMDSLRTAVARLGERSVEEGAQLNARLDRLEAQLTAANERAIARHAATVREVCVVVGATMEHEASLIRDSLQDIRQLIENLNHRPRSGARPDDSIRGDAGSTPLKANISGFSIDKGAKTPTARGLAPYILKSGKAKY